MCGINLVRSAPPVAGQVLLVGVGRKQAGEDMRGLSAALAPAGAAVELQTVAIQPFWNLIGYVDTAAISELTAEWLAAHTPR